MFAQLLPIETGYPQKPGAHSMWYPLELGIHSVWYPQMFAQLVPTTCGTHKNWVPTGVRPAYTHKNWVPTGARPAYTHSTWYPQVFVQLKPTARGTHRCSSSLYPQQTKTMLVLQAIAPSFHTLGGAARAAPTVYDSTHARAVPTVNAVNPCQSCIYRL